MKTNMRWIVGAMIAIIAACSVFLWVQGQGDEDILNGLDPESFDVEITCMDKKGQYLICNEGQDTVLVYDDVEVYVKKVDTLVKENGDETTTTTYKNSSFSKLEKSLQKGESVLLHLWLTEQGQIETIMMVETSFTDNNLSLANLEGLDPNSYQSTNVMLSISKKQLKLAPVNYTDAEQDKFEGLINQYSFAKNVKFYLGDITLTSDEAGNQTKNIQYAKLSYSDMLKLDKNAVVHVWFNENGEISHVLVHQETHI